MSYQSDHVCNNVDILLIFIAFLLVLLNAFFVAAEFGMVKLRHTRVVTIKDIYGLKGRILEHVHRHVDAYLSACQLGITLASLGLGWIGEPAFARLFRRLFGFMGIFSPELKVVIAFFVAFLILSFLHIVIGELMPKSLAIRQSEKVSVWTAVPLYIFYWVMYPVIWLLNACSNFLLKAMGLAEIHRGERFYSTEEIKLILSASHLHGELTKEEMEMMEHTLDFADLRVTEVMRPREEIIMLDIQQPVKNLLETVIQHRYSRYPVYDSLQKKILGILHVKDLFAALYQQQKISNISSLIRPVLKVSHRLPALDLLQKFREGVPHFALIYRGRENLIGFVTLDNLLHILIGRIKDEFHRTQEDWVANPDGTFSVKGECSIYSLERALDRDIEMGEEDEELETLSELIIRKVGRLPKEGERVEFEEFAALIEKRQNSRIQSVRIYPKPEKKEEPFI